MGRILGGREVDKKAERAENVVEVKAEHHWGTAVGDSIEVNSKCIYHLLGEHNLTKGLIDPEGGNLHIKGSSQLINKINFSCPTQPFLRSAAGAGVSSLVMHDLQVDFASASQQLFNVESDRSGPLLMRNCSFLGFLNSGIGRLSSFLSATFENVACVGAPTWSGPLLIEDMDTAIDICGFFNAVSSGGPLLRFETTGPYTIVVGSSRILPRAGESGIEVSASVLNAASRVTVREIISVLDGVDPDSAPLFSPSGLDSKSPQVFSFANFGRPTSHLASEGNFTANADETDIPAAGALVMPHSGDTPSWTYHEDEANRVSGGIDGVLTITALEPVLTIFTGELRINPQVSNKNIRAVWGVIQTEGATVTFDDFADTFTSTETLEAGQLVSFYNAPGGLPSPLRKDILYYVIGAGPYQLSYTEGGSAIDFTGAGSGTLIHDFAELHGSREPENIIAGTPRNVFVKGLAEVDTGEKVSMFISNVDDGVDILVAGGYSQLSGKS